MVGPLVTMNGVAHNLFPDFRSREFCERRQVVHIGREPLIKSQVQSGPEPNIDKKTQPFRSPLAFSPTMEGICSAQVQAQKSTAKD
jgi:hypothetical protein